MMCFVPMICVDKCLNFYFLVSLLWGLFIYTNSSIPQVFFFFMSTTPHSPLHLSYLQSFANKDCDVQYAVLDAAALASSPRSSVHSCGDFVEYATIQLSSQ